VALPAPRPYADAVLRRFESYAFADRTTPEQIGELTRVLQRAGEFIPEVLYSAVGRNESEADVELVWEHAYDGPDAYARYMCHPYHICELDRYLLPESPECITAPRPRLGLGLFGYEVEGEPFRVDRGVRRVVAMKATPGVASEAWDSFAVELETRTAHVAGLRVSVVAANTMGLEWWPSGWTHVWEQAFDDDDTMRRAREEERTLLAAGPLDGWVDVHYRFEVGS
jgi:hypothetical protein